MCKVPSYVAYQRGTSGRQVGSDAGSGAVGARGKPGAGAEGEWEAEVEGKAGGAFNCKDVPSPYHFIKKEVVPLFLHLSANCMVTAKPGIGLLSN